MAFETASDRLAYLTAFGEQVTFYVGATNWDAYAIFDNEFVEIDGVESRRPVLMCRVYDIYDPNAARDGTGAAAIAYRATSVNATAGGYDIVQVERDGVGMVTLILEMQ